MAEALGIEIRNLYKIFGTSPAAHVQKVKDGVTKTELMQRHQHVLGLQDINISVPAGSIQVVMGLSGSGKSTLIRHINRLIEPTAGEVLIGGADVVKMGKAELQQFRRHQTAMVFQRFALLPHRTVLENTVFGLEIQNVPRPQQVERAMRWIERVGLAGFENRFPNQLSGGMQQRVGLARALATDAPILLMDEAYSALDPLIRMDMQTVLLDLQQEFRKTIVFITHDLDEALRLGDRIAILRDGQMIQQGTSQDIVLRPADEYVAKFVREVNRGRFIFADAVMGPRVEHPTGLTVDCRDTLDHAMRVLAISGLPNACVLDDTGRAIGAIDMGRIARAMALPEPSSQTEEKVSVFS